MATWDRTSSTVNPAHYTKLAEAAPRLSPSPRAQNVTDLTQATGPEIRPEPQPSGELALDAAIVPDTNGHMARCTAPVNGHRTASGRADCPACGGRYRGYSSYGSYSSYSSPSSYASSGGSGVARSSVGGAGSRRPRWSRPGSSVVYTDAQVRTLTPFRESVEKRASVPDLRDVFLCHAWDDRKGAARSCTICSSH